jgi:hydroxypyruvate reductase
MTFPSAQSLMSGLTAFQGEIDPETLAGSYLQEVGIGTTVPGRILCLGKAAPGLARAASCRWPGVAGLLYGNAPSGDAPERYLTLWGDHPFPSEGNLRRTEEVRRWIRRGEGPLLALVSGGGSSLLVAPRSPWSLSDKLALTSRLLCSGAPIREVNAVRSRLSDVKAGGLLDDVRRWPCATLVWSDVGPRDWRYVASGPTIPVQRGRDAEAILERRSIPYPLALPAAKAAVRPRPGDSAAVLCDALTVRRALAPFMRARGYGVRQIAVPEGQSADHLAEVLVRGFFAKRARRPRAWIGVGEATVKVRAGGGAGGRCSHLAAAVSLAALRSGAGRAWAFAAIATDGVDGDAGGGAWVDARSLPSQRALEKALADFDTGTLWLEHGSALPRSPTGNNLRDLWVLAEC